MELTPYHMPLLALVCFLFCVAPIIAGLHSVFTGPNEPEDQLFRIICVLAFGAAIAFGLTLVRETFGHESWLVGENLVEIRTSLFGRHETHPLRSATLRFEVEYVDGDLPLGWRLVIQETSGKRKQVHREGRHTLSPHEPPSPSMSALAAFLSEYTGWPVEGG